MNACVGDAGGDQLTVTWHCDQDYNYHQTCVILTSFYRVSPQNIPRLKIKVKSLECFLGHPVVQSRAFITTTDSKIQVAEVILSTRRSINPKNRYG